MTPEPFAFPGFHGEAGPALAGVDAAAEARRLLDPTCAVETVHWGRNYLYRARIATPGGPIDAVVKQFRHDKPRARWRRRQIGSKARLSWDMGGELAAAGIRTPEPLLVAESDDLAGPAIFVSRLVEEVFEARYFLRARNAGREAEEFPRVSAPALLAAIARLARDLHAASFFFRDFSVGNLLVRPGETPAAPPAIWLVDLNRCRRVSHLGLRRRMADLSRLPLARASDRARLLAEYFERRPSAAERAVYESLRRAFLARQRTKSALRRPFAKLRGWLVPRGAHVHIPPAPERAGARDKVVWDALSDQPHQHASRGERLRERLADLPLHARSFAALAGAAPGAWTRYRELARRGEAIDSVWPGVGVALRPWARDPQALLALLERLGTRQALVRLHPWQARHDDEEALVRELAGRGFELAFALPQNRDLVRDPARWRAAIEELGARFLPYGRTFQIGQAINRSKWGVWNWGEYLELAGAAAEILRRRGDVCLLGPAVIDFEYQATAAVLNLRHPTLAFDAVSALLYVDRRGAPENPQLGFDLPAKVRLLAAIAGTARLARSSRVWITEVNWPLAEGPHSPAGKSVAVTEEEAADYLVRYYVLALATGQVERCYWWQLVAKGYGLVDVAPDGALRERPAFRAFAALARRLPPGTRSAGRVAAGEGNYAYRFLPPGDRELWAVWRPAGRGSWRPPRAPLALAGRDGEPRAAAPGGGPLELGPSPLWIELARED